MPTSPPQSPTTPSASPSTKGSKRNNHTTVEFHKFVDKRIEKTRRVVKLADLFASLAGLVTGILGLLLLAAIAEHWLVPGGFGTNERTGLWAILLIGTGVYFARYLFPLLTRRVNKLYAADELERESPELKNSLVNLLQLREQGIPSPVIQQMLEQQAAERLSGIEDRGVDLGPLLRIGYVLAGVVALTGLYIVLSPKDFFTSAQRVILPWSEIAAPSRVAIEDVSPGDTVLSQGDRLPVSLRILGLEEEETAELIFTTSDGRIVEKRVSLLSDEGSVRYSVELPASQSALGLQSDLTYRIEAGDVRTRNYEVEVLTTPTIAPQTIQYDYPEYTGFVNRTVEGGGDLQAIEGTRVTITTEANLPIESAQIDFYADGRPDVRMKAEGKQAKATFVMKRRGDTVGFSPEISNYVLRFTSVEGKTNRKPALYHREVIADLPPEARLIFPEEPIHPVRVGDSVEIAVEARDPDFALNEVRLVGEVNGRKVLDETLLKIGRRSEGHQGKFVSSHWLTPKKLGLDAGQKLDYWVEAADNRQPGPNRNRSEKQQIVILGDPDSGNSSENGEGDPSGSSADQRGEGEPSNEGQSEQGQSEKGQSDEGQNNEGQPNQQQGNGEQGNTEQGESSEEGSPGGESSNGNQSNEGQSGSEATQQETNNPDDQKQPPQGERGQEGIQGEGDENGRGQPDDSSAANKGPESNQANEEPSDSGPQGQGGSNQREGQDDPNQEPGADSDSGGRGEQIQTEDDTPVADDGSDDGAAFDKIREHLAQKREATEEERNADDPNRQTKTGEQDQSNQNQPKQGQGEPEQGENAQRPEAGDAQRGESRDPTDADPDREDRPSEQNPSEGNKSGKQSDSQSSESTDSGERGNDSKPNEGPRQGTGSEGQNQAADDGSGQSGDRGPGESTGRQGNQQTSEDPSSSADEPSEEGVSEQRDGGRSGEDNQSGNGKSKAGDDSQSNDARGQGNKASDRNPGKEGEEATPASDRQGSPSDEQGSDNEQSNRDQKRDESREGNPQGPEHSGGSQALDRPDGNQDAPEPGGDDANLDYARKQTDLVLEELSKQMDKNQIDQELLDNLGWSEDDLRRFVDRWQERKTRANRTSNQGQSELDAALRSLGLNPEGQRLNGSPQIKEDSMRDLQQGKRTSIPPALRERMQRYNRGVSRGESR